MYRKIMAALLASVVTCLLVSCSTPKLSAPNANQDDLNVFSFFLDDSVWSSISDNLTLIAAPYPSPLQHDIHWLAQHRLYIQQLAKNAGPYIYYVYHQTQVKNLPAELALMPMIESAYNPFDYSKAGATGLWQMMPGTASGFGLKINWWYDGRRDIVDSTQAALSYLKYLHHFFNNNWLLAIAAYDSGEGTVQQAVRYNKAHHLPTDFWALPLPRETKAYVPKLLALAVIFSDPGDYHITLPQVPNRPYFGAVQMNQQIDISTIAQFAGITTAAVRALNPGFRRWATMPNASYHLLLPEKAVSAFKQHLNNRRHKTLVTWLHHIVKPSETLSTIACHYHTSITILMRVNGLHSSLIHIHQDLLVPLASHGFFSRHRLNKNSSIAETKLPGPQKQVYVIKHGDTLWSVAEHFNVYVSSLLFWNQLPPHAHLVPGDHIVIWMPPRSYETTAYHHYVVKHGDSLSRIAHEYHTTVAKIKQINHLRSNIIHVKEHLKLPYITYHHSDHRYHNTMLIHHVKPGETIDELARRFHVNPTDIERWNHIQHQRFLHVGEKLVIYQ